MPEINPPPPIGTTSVSRSPCCSSISRPKVPCPAITVAIVVRMNERHVPFRCERLGVRQRLVELIAVQHDLGAEHTGLLDLGVRSDARHHDAGRNLHAPTVKGERLGVISRRHGNDASRPLAALNETNQPAVQDGLTPLFTLRSSTKLRELSWYHRLTAVKTPLGATNPQRVLAASYLLTESPTLDEEVRSLCSLLEVVQASVRAKRQAASQLDFADVLVLARDLLRDHPSVAEALRATHALLLIDEFQDTSRVQRELVLLLARRKVELAPLVRGQLPAVEELSERGLIIVGDRKQSIYGFRGADVAVFTELAAALAGQAATQALHLQGSWASSTPIAEFHTQQISRRSGSRIVEAVNTIAKADFESEPSESFEIAYSDAEHLLADPARGEGKVVMLMAPSGGEPSSAANPEVQAQTAAKYVATRQSDYALADIAILCRRRATMPYVELELDRLRIPYVVAGRALYRQPEIRDVVAALRLALDPRDRHALATIARSPLVGLSDPQLAALCSPERGLLPVGQWRRPSLTPEHRRAANVAATRIETYCQVASRVSPRDALALAIEHFDYDSVLAAVPRGQLRLGNIHRLMEIASRQGGSLSEFVRFVDHQIRIDADETEAAIFSDEDDAVRLLTIHGSKGLAFPLVVVLDVEAREQPHSPPIRVHEDGDQLKVLLRHRTPVGPVRTPVSSAATKLASRRGRSERQRLSYVALTRAKDELAIVIPPVKARSDSLLATLTALTESGALAAAGVEVLEGSELNAASAARSSAPTPRLAPRLPDEPQTGLISLGATALADFAICPRRFELIHAVGLEEPAARFSGGVSALGEGAREAGTAAHRVLELWPVEDFGKDVSPDSIREALRAYGFDGNDQAEIETAEGIRRFIGSEYARGLRHSHATIEREVTWLTPLGVPQRNEPQLALFASGAPPTEPRGAALVLRCTLDLVVRRGDAELDVIDYKRSRSADERRYRAQLEAYRAAARHRYPGARVRTGLVSLLAPDPAPVWLRPRSVDLLSLAERLAEARALDQFEQVPRRRCETAHCGFVDACHQRGTDTSTS